MENSDRTAVTFDPARFLHALMLLVMIGTVSWSIASFITLWIAVPIGAGLTYAFDNRVKVAMGIIPTRSRAERVLAGVTAWLLFCLTMGLSYGALYKTVFAEPSALRQLQDVRAPVQRQLDIVLADAAAARGAFDAWAKDSREKAALESRLVDGGGSCPGKKSGGRKGPIAHWRDAEASIAGKLNTDLDGAIKDLESKVKAVPTARPADYTAAVEIMARLNAAIAVAETATRGGAARAALDTLDRQLNSTITWVDGTKFDCHDTARTDLILTAQKALKGLQALPALKPIEPAIDLTNRQEVATRGLLRSFNAGAKIASFGMVGSFADDELMLKAQQQSGIVNRESLGLGLAALLEMTVALTAAIAARRGGAPLPMNFMQGFEAWQHAADRAQGGRALMHKLTLSAAKAAFNLLFASIEPGRGERPSAEPPETAPIPFKSSRHPVVVLEADPNVPGRELGWAKELLPWLFGWHDKDYIVLPNDRAPKASLAARALEYNNAAALLGTDVPWEVVAKHRAAARRLLRLLPDARASHFEVYELATPVAQALRINLLAGSSDA
jgi:hypothetical protein